MERILSDNEKIRKAEEIYYKRNHKNVPIDKNERKQKTYLGSKILLELLILLLIAIIIFAIKNKDYIFSQDFLERMSQYNLNLTEKFNSFVAYFIEDDNQSEDIFINGEQNENTEMEGPVNQEETQTEQNEAQVVVDNIQTLKTLYSFIKPIEGVISSGFGARESEYQNITGEHTGIDIATESGTIIKSAISGIVTQVSTEGDYGNHIKITKDNISTLYAHCLDMYVTEGQEIVQGQEIASVGSTGNSTGPHLHFEIRIDDNPINPAEVIEF